MNERAKASAMRMVITLKSGVQIKADVEDFTTGSGHLSGDLRSLKQTTTEQPGAVINWLDIGEVAAVHAEFSYDGQPAAQVPEAGDD